MKRKYTHTLIGVMCKCTRAYVSKVLNNPRNHNTERAKNIKRLAYDHLESIVSDPLFLQLIRKYRPKTQEEENTLDEWKYTHKLYNNKLSEIKKNR